MDFYRAQQLRYFTSTKEQRAASGRDDLIIFSAKILAMYDIVDAVLKE